VSKKIKLPKNRNPYGVSVLSVIETMERELKDLKEYLYAEGGCMHLPNICVGGVEDFHKLAALAAQGAGALSGYNAYVRGANHPPHRRDVP
jgi:hypothetical protein